MKTTSGPRLLLALLFLAAAASAQAQSTWLNETFSSYTNGQTLSPTLSPQLFASLTSPTNFTKITNDSGNVARYQKANSSGTASAPQFAFSPTNNIVARASGYVSFKLKQNVDALAPSNMTNQSWYMGIANTNPTTSINTSANRIISMQFKQSGAAACQVSVESAATSIVSSYNWSNSTAYSLVQIWFNDSDTASMSYTNPLGVASSLATNCFVVYIDNNLVTTTNSGNAPLTGAGGNSLNVGKMGFGTGSTTTNIDFSFGSLYASDSAPGPTNAPSITSAANATALLNFPFSYQIITDPPGATSYALTGTLPGGLSFNSTNGLISGTPTALGGPTTVVLAASNSVGTGPSFNFSVTVGVPLNVFSGINPSLNIDSSWSLGAAPTPVASLGSYQDVSLASSVTNLTTAAAALTVKSWNVTNGSNYTITSLKSDGSTTYQLGKTTNTNTFTNSVSGVVNDLVYLTNNSSLTFSALNSSVTPTNSTVNLALGGNLNVSAGSTLSIDAVLTAPSVNYSINKTGNGTLNLSGANTFGSSAAGTTLTSGTLNVKGSSAPARLAQVKAEVDLVGVVTNLTIVDGGAGYTVAPTISISKSSDSAGSGASALATIANGAVTAINLVNGGSGYTNTNSSMATFGQPLPPRVYAYSAQSPLGVGVNRFNGGILNASVDTDISRMTTFADGTNAFFRINGFDTAFNSSVTLSVDAGKTLSSYTLIGNTNSANLITKIGAGTLQLRGGGASGIIGDWLINEGTLFLNTTASSGLGVSNSLILNGGNLLLSKGIGSTGTYSGFGQDSGLKVQQGGMITLNPNTNTAPGANTASFTNLVISNQTLTLVKGAEAFCSTNPGYTDPQITFKAVTLNGSATIAVGTNMETVLQGGTGTGGVTKTGSGKLTISSGSFVTNSVTNSVPNTYTGPTTITAGTLQLGGSHASSITIGANAVLESTLSATPPSTAGSLTFASGAKVRISGTPDGTTSYVLVTATNGIIGTPDLETPVVGYSLTTGANSLILTNNSVDPAPSGLSYTPSSQIGTVGTAISGMSPTVTGAVTNYSVSPALPAGLSIDSGSGVISGTPTAATASASYTVTAANAGGSTTANVTISVGKATPSISVPPTASSIVQGQSLASSTLSGGTASVSGTFAWTDPSYVPVTAGIWGESVTFTPTDTANYNTNTTSASVTVVSQYNNWLQGQTNNSTNQLAYAIGGASSPTATNGVASTTTVTSNTLSITAIVRTNDPSLAVYGQSITNLSVGTWVTNDVIMSVSTNQTGATPGTTQRQTFTTPRATNDAKKFLRLNTTLGGQ